MDYCQDCKYCPENLVWAEQCKKKKMSITNKGQIRYTFVMLDANEDGTCKHYKRSFVKKIKDFMGKISK